MKTLEAIERMHGELTAFRRDIHAHPEIAFEEVRTSAKVAEKLKSFGLEVHEGIAKTGLVAVLRGKLPTPAGQKPRSIGLRADMDALPMPELNRFAHASKHPGHMHGCGHDGHTTMLLGAAQYLAAHPDLTGMLNFIFQPADENGNAAAREMIREGLFERFPCDAVFGIHNMPGMPENHFGFRPGPLMASSNRFNIVVRGVGGHAAQPHNAIDPVVMSAEMVLSMQTLVSRLTNPLDPVVLTITQIHGGDAYNVIPDQVILRGTVRTYTTEALDRIEAGMNRIVKTLPTVYGGSGELEFIRAYPPVVNHVDETALATQVAIDTFGADNVTRELAPFMGAEDFSFYLNEIPGAYLFLGNGSGEHREAAFEGMGPCQLHNSNYDFNDALIPVGATFFVNLVKRYLATARA